MKFDTLYQQIIKEFVDLTKKTYSAHFTFPASFHSISGGVQDLTVTFTAENKKQALLQALLFTFSGFKRDKEGNPAFLSDPKLKKEAEQNAISWWEEFGGENSIKEILNSIIETYEFDKESEENPSYGLDEDVEVYIKELSPNSAEVKPEKSSSKYTVDTVKDLFKKSGRI